MSEPSEWGEMMSGMKSRLLGGAAITAVLAMTGSAVATFEVNVAGSTDLGLKPILGAAATDDGFRFFDGQLAARAEARRNARQDALASDAGRAAPRFFGGNAAQRDAATDFDLGEPVFGVAPPDNGISFDAVLITDRGDPEVNFVPSITLDNGIRIGANMQFEKGLDQDVIQNALASLRGSFGQVPLGEYGVGPHCGDPGQDTALDRTQTRAGFVVNLDNFRGALAAEIGGKLVNPAIGVENKLSGRAFGPAITGCTDILPFPTYFTFGTRFGRYDSSVMLFDLNFAETLNIPGVGGIPGVFIPSETDVTELDFTAGRRQNEFSFRVDQPFIVGGRNLFASNGGRPPVTYAVSAVAGLRFGNLWQMEAVDITTDSPAYGGDSASTIMYDTEFDSRFTGLYAGLSLDTEIGIRPSLSLTSSLSGVVGFDRHRFMVDDSVTAAGLGVVLDYANAETHDYQLSTRTAGLSASVGVATDRLTASLTVGTERGFLPTLDYRRPDSDAEGALDPTLELAGTWSRNINVSVGIKY